MHSLRKGPECDLVKKSRAIAVQTSNLCSIVAVSAHSSKYLDL